MKHLFFVSVATSILSGTTLTIKAQSFVNYEKISTSVPLKKSYQFIEGIEIKTGTAISENIVKINTAELKTASLQPRWDKTETGAIESCSLLQFKYALLLDMNVESVTNKVLFAEIEKWWATRYKYGGATEKGIDCSAYTGTLIYKAYCLVIPRTSRDQFGDCIKIDKEELQQGDLVFFKTGRRVSHVGLYLGNGYFTHASTSIGVTISNLSEIYWSKKFKGGGRITPAASE